jgi:hypothetical protein
MRAVTPTPTQEPFDHEERLFHFSRRGSITEKTEIRPVESENVKVFNTVLTPFERQFISPHFAPN